MLVAGGGTGRFVPGARRRETCASSWSTPAPRPCGAPDASRGLGCRSGSRRFAPECARAPGIRRRAGRRGGVLRDRPDAGDARVARRDEHRRPFSSSRWRRGRARCSRTAISHRRRQSAPCSTSGVVTLPGLKHVHYFTPRRGRRAGGIGRARRCVAVDGVCYVPDGPLRHSCRRGAAARPVARRKRSATIERRCREPPGTSRAAARLGRHRRSRPAPAIRRCTRPAR